MWQHVAAAPAWSTHYIYFTGDGSQGVLHATGVGGGSMRENQLEVELKKKSYWIFDHREKSWNLWLH